MEEDRKYLLAAFEEAEKSLKEGNHPILRIESYGLWLSDESEGV